MSGLISYTFYRFYLLTLYRNENDYFRFVSKANRINQMAIKILFFVVKLKDLYRALSLR